ncbi:malonic semialdehyde reductase [Altericroceibacterium xinjiangense]|uniref:malonic semialdehyde reductase n=1 Tax=Altericroceibacterium xinjiangense TaxID=762261 RepID=UPI000F7E597E|nr:malonic semialdehyde reductase [Altericroceibacterium xinjiangense]
MSDTLPPTALDQLFHEARTYNAWLDKDVSDEQVRQIWDLVKMAPTSANQLPARLIWCKSAQAKERLAAHASEANRPKITGAPVCVIVAMDTDFHEQLPWLFPHADAKSWFAGNADLREVSAFRNSTLQGAYLIMAARAVGLDCGPMSGFDNAALDKDFFADEPKWKSNFICSIGYGDPESLFARSPRPDFDAFNRIL